VAPWLSEADVVLVLDGLAPWSPDVHTPKASAKIVNLGPDPLHHRFPVRNFRSDLSITGEVDDALVRLETMMASMAESRGKAVLARRARVAERVAKSREALNAAAIEGATVPMTKAWVAKCVGEAVKDYDATVLCELGCPLDHVRPIEHGSWRDLPHSGGLGWSLPTGMGMKLAEPERLIVSTMGDGSYMFANPVACHQIAEAYAIATLTVILNNQEWFAVRRAALGMYPQGHAAKANQMPLTALSPSPEFARIVEASRGYGQTVTDPTELPKALARGIDVVMNEKRAAVINVMVA
jgi:acetolactate synthase-1/2/3 large subunit